MMHGWVGAFLVERGAGDTWYGDAGAGVRPKVVGHAEVPQCICGNHDGSHRPSILGILKLQTKESYHGQEGKGQTVRQVQLLDQVRHTGLECTVQCAMQKLQ